MHGLLNVKYVHSDNLTFTISFTLCEIYDRPSAQQ